MGEPLIDLTFEAWVDHVFDHPIDPPGSFWYLEFDTDWWAGPPGLTVAYLTRLFEAPEFLRDRFAPEQLEQGLWYVNGSIDPMTLAFFDRGIKPATRERGLRSVGIFFERFFAIGPSRGLGHRSREAVPIDTVCYMWWDNFPTYGGPDDVSTPEENALLLGLMQRILEVPSPRCRESALHGLGHWQTYHPEAVGVMINGFLARHPEIDDDLRHYAWQAREGAVL